MVHVKPLARDQQVCLQWMKQTVNYRVIYTLLSISDHYFCYGSCIQVLDSIADLVCNMALQGGGRRSTPGRIGWHDSSSFGCLGLQRESRFRRAVRILHSIARLGANAKRTFHALSLVGFPAPSQTPPIPTPSTGPSNTPIHNFK